MEKRLSHSEEHPERFAELHGEEKREEGDKGDQEEKRGAKRRETDLANNQFPKCSPQPRIPRGSQSWVEKRSGEGGDRGDLGEKKESQKGERAIKPVITLLSKNGS